MQLHTFVLRVGSLFALAHQQPSQSEPERSHFAIVRGQHALPPEDVDLLEEAVKWSVMFEEAQTKVKDSMRAVDYEYVLNPIYSAYFGITYRKKRKLELPVEEFWTVYLNGKNEPLGSRMVSRGTLTTSLVHPREVFSPALWLRADGVVFLHNHPSGDPTPSLEDVSITERLVQAGDLLGIRVLDHVIVPARPDGYVSFHERGLLNGG